MAYGMLSSTYLKDPPGIFYQNWGFMPPKRSGHANIKDVAKMAGVSTATVSRVLSGVGYVSDRSRKSVESAIAELNYTPSQVARSLREQRSPIIGLIVTDIKNPYYPELVSSVETSLTKLGYSMILCNTEDDSDREINYLNFLTSQRADGIIICTSGLFQRHQKKIESMGTNIVLADFRAPDTKFPTVTSDDYVGGQLVGKHLKECGYPRIVYLGIPQEHKDGAHRYEGLKAGCGSIPTHYFDIDETTQSQEELTKRIIKEVPTPFAVFAHNDMVAISTMHTLTSMGVNVPNDVGVVGYDDIAIASMVNPELTTVKHHHKELGQQAVALLDQMIQGKKPNKNYEVELELVVRKSTTKI